MLAVGLDLGWKSHRNSNKFKSSLRFGMRRVFLSGGFVVNLVVCCENVVAENLFVVDPWRRALDSNDGS